MKSLVAFDCETTGLKAHENGIVELAAVKRDTEGTLTEWAHLMKSAFPISEGAGKCNGLTDEMLMNKHSFAEMYASFMEFIGDGVLIGHNSSFDVGFIAHECKRAGLTTPSNLVLDTLPMARTAYPQLRNHKLGTLVEALHLSVQNTHRALADSHAALCLYDRCAVALGIGLTENYGLQKVAGAAGGRFVNPLSFVVRWTVV